MQARPSDAAQRKRRLAEGPGRSNAAPPEADAGPACFSVIIPTLDEVGALPETLASLNVFRRVAEVIVVDGGSRDGTRHAAREAGAHVLHTVPGRGPQMNAGALAARSDHLLFLHADCRLPADAFEAIDAVRAQGRRAGLFPIDFESSHPILRTLSRLSHWPSRWTQFGEGALFLERSLFEEVGGFPDWPLMEDVEMLRRLRRTGQLGCAPSTVRASPRRFHEAGVVRQLLRNISCYTLYHLGWSPERLVSLYVGDRSLKRRST